MFRIFVLVVCMYACVSFNIENYQSEKMTRQELMRK